MHNSIEVITPAACMDLTVLDTVKMELGIPTGDTSKDDQLTVMIKQASGIVADYCNRVFGAEEVLETFWCDFPSSYERSFMLARLPVIDILEVVIDGQTLDPSEYRVATDGHLHRMSTTGMSFWCLTGTAEIHYTGGYVLLDDLPFGIERAAISLIKENYFSIGVDPSIRSEDIPGIRRVDYQVSRGSGSSSGSSTLSPDVIALLYPHRRLAFA